MWIREALTDLPPRARAAVPAAWLRVVALAACAVLVGRVLDQALVSGGWARPGLAALGCAAVGAIAGAVAESLAGSARADEEARWRGRVLEAALAPGAAAVPDGELVDAATTGVEKTAGYRATFLGPTLASFTSPLLVLAVWALAVDAATAAVLALFVALVPVVSTLAAGRLRGASHAYRRLEARDSARYLEMLESLGTLRVFEADERYRRRHARDARATMTELGRLLARNQRMIVVDDAVFGVLMSCAACGLALGGLATGRFGVGAALTGVLLSVLLREPIDRVGRTFYVGLAGRARRDQLEDLLAGHAGGTSTSVGSDGVADIRAGAAPRVTLEGVDVDLGGRPVLDGVDLEVPAGTTVGLVGASGAGKTTLLRVVCGLREPDAGRVLLDGVEATPAQLRAACVLVSQHPGLLSTTVADNLRLAAPAASDAELWDALETAHLAPEVRAMAQGLDTPVGDGGALLSGGQARRLAIARALLSDAPVLVLDEPTADLDRATEARVRDALARAAAGRTVLLVTHRRAALVGADRVLVLDGGRATVTTPTAPEEAAR